MYVTTDSVDTEVRMAIEAAVELANALADGGGRERTREILVEHQYFGSTSASDREVDDVEGRFGAIATLIHAFPDAELSAAVAGLNETLAAYRVAPSVQEHDGSPLHIHWTDPRSRFDDHVIVDVLMALAQTICDSGLERFGTCAASDCERVFFDSTKNMSRRFCSDPRCASRTHTAAHRARLGSSPTSDESN
jgi:hypothetical protein